MGNIIHIMVREQSLLYDDARGIGLGFGVGGLWLVVIVSDVLICSIR